MSFASQKNDMLLRNMIFRLNVEMIDSPKGEYDMFVCDERDKLLTAMRLRPRRRFFDAAASCLAQNDSVGVHGVPMVFPNVNGWRKKWLFDG